jgi:hypothetical protein
MSPMAASLVRNGSCSFFSSPSGAGQTSLPAPPSVEVGQVGADLRVRPIVGVRFIAPVRRKSFLFRSSSGFFGDSRTKGRTWTPARNRRGDEKKNRRRRTLCILSNPRRHSSLLSFLYSAVGQPPLSLFRRSSAKVNTPPSSPHTLRLCASSDGFGAGVRFFIRASRWSPPALI